MKESLYGMARYYETNSETRAWALFFLRLRADHDGQANELGLYPYR